MISKIQWRKLNLLGLFHLLQSDSPSLGQAEKLTPGWVGTNALIKEDDIVRPSVIGYLPVVPNLPTERLIFLLLLCSLTSANKLGQQPVPIMLDQAIYSKAREILWKHCDQFSRFVLLLGSFQTTMVLLAIIGKRSGDAGLQDILVESGTVWPRAIAKVMCSKQCNRTMRSSNYDGSLVSPSLEEVWGLADWADWPR